MTLLLVKELDAYWSQEEINNNNMLPGSPANLPVLWLLRVVVFFAQIK